MLCIGYAKSVPDEGSASTERYPSPALASLRHPLPQGEQRPADLPVRLFCNTAVQCHQQKYFASPFARNSFIDSAVPPQPEGRIAIVTDVERGMRWTQAALLTRALTLRTAKSCGPDAPTLASSWRKPFRR